MELVARFWSKVQKSPGCWLWMAGTDGRYGVIRISGKCKKAHRVAYELEYGSIPDGHCIHHRCGNKLCVKPMHLVIATRRDNSQDAHNSNHHPGHQNYGTYEIQSDREDTVYLRIAEMAKSNGYSRASLARASGVSEPTVGRYWNNALVYWDRFVLRDIAKTLQSSIADLIVET